MTQLILSTTPVVSFIDDESNASFDYDYRAFLLKQQKEWHKARKQVIWQVVRGAVLKADYYRLTYDYGERSTHTDEEIITWIIGGDHAS